jgi:hypothetical protein
MQLYYYTEIARVARLGSSYEMIRSRSPITTLTKVGQVNTALKSPSLRSETMW